MNDIVPIDSTPSMKKSILAQISTGAFALALLVACGGGTERSYPSYGVDIATLRSAPTSLVSDNAGTVQLVATAMDRDFVFDVMDTRIDPVTGQIHVSSRPSANAQRMIFLGFALMKPKLTGGYELTPTEWNARTVWILQGEKYISTKDIKIKDGIFSLILDDPPLNRNQPAIIVVDFNTATETTLLQGSIQWD